MKIEQQNHIQEYKKLSYYHFLCTIDKKKKNK